MYGSGLQKMKSARQLCGGHPIYIKWGDDLPQNHFVLKSDP